MILDGRQTTVTYLDIDGFKNLIGYWEEQDYFDSNFPGLFTDGDIYIAVPLNGKVSLDQVETKECFIQNHSILHVNGSILMCSCDGMWILFKRPEIDTEMIGVLISHSDNGKSVNFKRDVFTYTEPHGQVPLYGLKKFNWDVNKYMSPEAATVLDIHLASARKASVMPNTVEGSAC